MEAHQRSMSDTVNSRERDVNLLFMTADGETASFARELDALGVDVSGDQDDVNESAQEALWNYALSVETRTVVRVVLGIGGPTTFMEADVSKGEYSWERDGAVTFFDSWAVPQETSLADDSALVRLFDQYLETFDGQ